MARAKIYHLAVKQRNADDSLLLLDRASWMWAAVRRAFPDALAAHLMRDHLHVVAPLSDLGVARQSLGRILGNYTRRFGFDAGHWRRADAPVVVRHREMLRMTVRYVALNACRERTARGTLEPLWSTHRDVVGAVAVPWVEATRLCTTLGWPRSEFRRRYHAFVSSDPSVAVDGEPLPVPAAPSTDRTCPLERIALATAAACREPLTAIRSSGLARHVFVALAADQGWSGSRVAACIDAHPRTVRRLRGLPLPTNALHAARLCLGDRRLTDGFEAFGRL